MSDSRHGYPWQKKALPGMFTYESPDYAGVRPVIWARKCEKGWFVQFHYGAHGLNATGTTRDRAAKELLGLWIEKMTGRKRGER